MFHNLFAKNDEFSGQSDVTVAPQTKTTHTYCNEQRASTEKGNTALW